MTLRIRSVEYEHSLMFFLKSYINPKTLPVFFILDPQENARGKYCFLGFAYFNFNF